jgi:hypothetical protein
MCECHCWFIRVLSPVLPRLPGPVPHDFAVDRARDAVVQFGIEFRERVAGVDGRVGDVPDSGGLDNVADDKLPDGLVLGDGLGAVDATDVADVAAAVLSAAVVAALRGHLKQKNIF